MTSPPYKVSIEYGHAELAPLTHLESLRSELSISAQIAKGLAERLRVDGVDVETVILIDDKEIPPGLDRVSASEALLDQIGTPADHVVEEDSLRTLAPSFFTLLPEKRGQKLQREALKRLERGQAMACSVDISIWHSFRLGLLSSPVAPHVAYPPSLASLGTYDLAVSVLPTRFRGFEDKALRENLRAIDPLISERIHDIYFDPSKKDLNIDQIVEISYNEIRRRLNAIHSGN